MTDERTNEQTNERNLAIISLDKMGTRPGVNKVKPKVWFKYFLKIYYKEQCWTVPPCSYLYLVLPALNWSALDAGILIIVQQVRLIMFLLNMVEFFFETFLLLMLKSYQWGGWVGTASYMEAQPAIGYVSGPCDSGVSPSLS